jgi:hypothetical protein
LYEHPITLEAFLGIGPNSGNFNLKEIKIESANEVILLAELVDLFNLDSFCFFA